MPTPQFKKTLDAFHQGKMVILVDDENRENEGDLAIAAEFATPEVINFMATHGRGLICLSLDESIVNRLQLPMMTKNNESGFQTPFTVSIEARHGVTTGISAFDRSHTIQTAIADDAKPSDLVSPGHIFPLKANSQGVLKREGQTEGVVDLAKLNHLKPAGVICEIMNPDGTMARMPELKKFAKAHSLEIISIEAIKNYRKQNEKLVEEKASAKLPIDPWGDFTIKVFHDVMNQQEHIALINPPLDLSKPILTRIHSKCLTGDLFASKRCDCGGQLDFALERIAKEGGVLLYLPQEGRGIGLTNKIKAYALQEQGMDTVEANHHLGFADDLRDYSIAAQIFVALGIKKMRLLTNNPRKLEQLQDLGLEVQREPITMKALSENQDYLSVKKDKLGHLLMGIV
jgi:3,4-dihydroxy 2-butanone 4-phosphate synthase / GTP cyclohydrolase II